MITAESVIKLYTDTNYEPKNEEVKPKQVNINISKVAIKSVLDTIKRINGFTTLKNIQFRSTYKRATIQRVIAFLDKQGMIEIKEVKNGRVKTLHIKYKKGSKNDITR